jgi:hypothetical protein
MLCLTVVPLPLDKNHFAFQSNNNNNNNLQRNLVSICPFEPEEMWKP